MVLKRHPDGYPVVCPVTPPPRSNTPVFYMSGEPQVYPVYSPDTPIPQPYPETPNLPGSSAYAAATTQPQGSTPYIAPYPPLFPPPYPPDVIQLQLDERLKDLQPHPGNPGSTSGGAWKDMWMGLLFILHLAGVGTVAALLGLKGIRRVADLDGQAYFFTIQHWIPQLAAAAIVGAVYACIWQTLMKKAPILMVHITLWTAVNTNFALGITLIATGNTIGLVGLIFIFLGIIQALFYYVVRRRIDFAAEMLHKVLSVLKRYPATSWVAYKAILVALAWLALWIFGVSGASGETQHAAIIVVFVFSLMWTLEVIQNLVRVAVAGTVSTFYFQEHNMPRRPTYLALFRACTTSFGSICLGSLFVTSIGWGSVVLRSISAEGGNEFLFSCIECLLSLFQRLILYFNKWAFVQVAIYGKPFVRASKDTWDMLVAQQIDVLINDDLVSPILLMACGIGGTLSGLAGGIWSWISQKNLTIAISVISFLIGFFISYLTMVVLDSAVATYYVCFAEDPSSLQQHDGAFFEKIWVRQLELLSPTTELTA